jgi:hypothetical protein
VVLAADPTVPDDLLDAFHRAVRDRLARYLDDQGGISSLAANKVQQVVSSRVALLTNLRRW